MAGPPKQKRSRDPSASSLPPPKKVKSSLKARSSKSPKASSLPIDTLLRTTSDATSPNPQASSSPAPTNPVDLSTYEVTSISILSSSSMQQRTTKILTLLRSSSGSSSTTEEGEQGKRKPCIVRLHANAKAASKLISVVEIVKREFKTSQAPCFQYTSVEGVIKEYQEPAKDIKKKGKAAEDKEYGGVDKDEDEGEEEEGFEMMKTPFERSIEGMKKVRAVPVLTIWLSREKVEALGRKLGEQNNGVEIPK